MEFRQRCGAEIRSHLLYRITTAAALAITMNGPPPPPPPHGENPHTTDGEYRKSSDLPPGNYDIFIVPPHSSGSGFLYLPSLQCHRNSFLAGAASTLLVVLVWSIVSPVVKTWYVAAVSNGNGVGMVVVALGLGVAGWALGASQSDGSKGDNGHGDGGRGFGGGRFGGGSNAHGWSSGANFGNEQQQQQHGGAGGPGQRQQGNFGGQNHGNQYAGNRHGAGAPPKTDQNNHGPNGAEWERAREETKRKEELRRKMEEFKRKREREAMEKELKERREKLEKEVAAAREKAEREAREKLEKEAAEARARQEKAEAEAKAEAERREAEAKEKAAAKAAAQKEAMAKFAALKEAAAKRYAEKKAAESRKEKGKETNKTNGPASAGSTPRTPSPKKPPFPTARTTVEEDDAYSFRPYDRPRRPYSTATGDSAYSESSYAPSQSTAHTTPPPSHRRTYSTKDPDKIVIHGVYAFNNAFMKTPVAQLVSGEGMVTDGLVLRITTEGLFIDDDLRGVGQREWDIKAWTLKLAEVWCPQMGASTQTGKGSNNPFSFRRSGSAHSIPTNEESDAFVVNLLKVCKNTCRLASPSACFARSANASGTNDGGPVHTSPAEFRGLHILRACLRDQEGKRYVFVVQDTEAWKVAIGLQRLRGGALVRALGVSALPVPECKSILGGLGYI